MESFWEIISRWHGFWQWFFLFCALNVTFSMLVRFTYHACVVLRGWPPKFKKDQEKRNVVEPHENLRLFC